MTITLSLLDPDAAPLIDRAMAVAQQLRRYDPALAALLVKAEGKARHTSSSKPKVRHLTHKGASGKVSKIDLGITDEQWKELNQ